MPRLPHFLDNQLTDDDEVISLMRQPPFTPRKILVLISVRPQGHRATGRIMLIEKFNDLIENRTRNLLACSIANKNAWTSGIFKKLLMSWEMELQMKENSTDSWQLCSTSSLRFF
jgi:hypothetical protein